ncbi:MAG: VOC family protein [Bacteroidota bacterium]
MENNQISYIEFKTNDLEKSKEFYRNTFNWSFKDYGPTYASFSESGVYGGFEQTDKEICNGALVVLYNNNLDKTKDRVIEFGGKISKEIFSFPGGNRFHFKDPSGNELAVWSDEER